jgi:hypothetical protein
MIIIGILLLFFVGLSVLNAISNQFGLLEKIGLSFLIGLGIFSLVMLPMDLFGVKINQLTLTIIGLVIVIGCNVKNYKLIFSGLKFDHDEIKKYALNFSWLLCFGIIIYLFSGIAQKAFYWPTLEYDAVAGYDLMAKAIAYDGKLNNSLFEYIRSSREYNRILYPPFVASTFAYGYIFGLKTAKLITLMHFGAFLLVFYAFISKEINRTGAILFTLAMMVTPEYFSHAAMALTNLPNAINTATGLISLYFWISKREKRYFYISVIMIAVNNWTRADAIVFSVASAGILLLDAIKNKTWKEFIIHPLITIIPFFAWSNYITKVLHAESSTGYFVKHLFWDSHKIGEIASYLNTYLVKGTDLFGLTFILLFILCCINAVHWKQSAHLFLLLSFVAWFMYTFIYYQMDNVSFDSLDFVMKASYKRGLFCFVPLAWYYIATNTAMVWVFNKIENFLYE